MSFTNKTDNLGLPQWLADDKPSWLVDMNGAFSAIDSARGEQITKNAEIDEAQATTNANVKTNTDAITAANTEIEAIEARVTEIEGGSVTKDLDEKVSTLETTVSTIESNVTENTDDLTTLKTTVQTLADDQVNQTEKITDNTEHISTIESSIEDINTNITTVNTQVTKNSADIATLQEEIKNIDPSGEDLSDEVAQNTADIATNKTSIETNASDIASLKTSVETNTTNIATNTSSIETLQTNVLSNTTSINSMKTDIQTNTDDLTINNALLRNPIGGGAKPVVLTFATIERLSSAQYTTGGYIISGRTLFVPHIYIPVSTGLTSGDVFLEFTVSTSGVVVPDTYNPRNATSFEVTGASIYNIEVWGIGSTGAATAISPFSIQHNSSTNYNEYQIIYTGSTITNGTYVGWYLSRLVIMIEFSE